jgi:hypothetical protein
MTGRRTKIGKNLYPHASQIQAKGIRAADYSDCECPVEERAEILELFHGPAEFDRHFLERHASCDQTPAPGPIVCAR